ncbi:hypothetical protein [Streptomyces cahuitamycinicus]|uniref:hypothetical protein n=1 Tax=Streptomyces cahuitamycinicus TaxID=2070367 RepID=UPI0026A13FF3
MTDAAYSRSGVFRARRRQDGRWNTGLLTTEGSQEGFTVRAGDVLEARVRLPEEIGAWPALRTWRDGDQEIDVFEYHPDNPDLLEFTNHVRGTNRYHHDPAIRPGAWGGPAYRLRHPLSGLVAQRQAGLHRRTKGGPDLARLPHRQPFRMRRSISPRTAIGND